MNSFTKKYSLVYNCIKRKNRICAKCDSCFKELLARWRHLQEVKGSSGPSVALSDNTHIALEKQGLIPLSNSFSKRDCTATNLTDLKCSSLVAVGSLCDDGKAVIFDKKKVHAIDNTSALQDIITNSAHCLSGNRGMGVGMYKSKN